MEKMRPVINHRVNNTRWCVLRWPTPAMAQQASMSTEAFEDFYFRVCLLDYKSLLPGDERAQEADGQGPTKSTSRAPAPTCASASRASRPSPAAATTTSPTARSSPRPCKDSVEGHVTYNAPTIYQGIAFDNVRLEFNKGKIVKATANNTKAINKILDSDEGARYIGEFAIGFNREIREPMRDILFDEKIAGSLPLHPGPGLRRHADNGNRSQVHWDMVYIQRPDYGGGEIWFDGKLIRKDGKFLPRELQKLNY